jgi:HD-like signal output (HDOD) protein
LNLESGVSLSVLHNSSAHRYVVNALSAPQTLAPMPRVCAQLTELVGRQDTDSQRLVRLIESDPAIVGAIMRVANSAALRPRTTLVSLQHAVSWLGVAEVRNIMVATALRGEVFVAPGHEPEAHTLWCEASLASLWAKEIARMRRSSVERAFMAGLMHRAGAALALKTLSRFEVAQRTAIDAQTFRSLVMEFEAPCGRILMNNWCLSSDIIDAAVDWRSYRSSNQAELAGTVNAAHLLAEHTLHPQLLTQDIVLGNPVFEQLGMTADARAELLQRVDAVREIAGS